MIGAGSVLPETRLAWPPAVLVIPSDGFNVVATAELKSVGPAWSATSGVFPFGFRWQSKFHCAATHLPCHLRNNRAGVEPTEKPVGTSNIVPRNILNRPEVSLKV